MTVQDDPLMALRIQLHQLHCPTCGTHELRPRLQCDYYPDGCLWLVRCEHCRAKYHLDHRRLPARWRTTTAVGRNYPATASLLSRDDRADVPIQLVPGTEREKA